MPEKDFLEQFPLYRKLQKQFHGTIDNLEKVAIHMDCEICGSGQTFLMDNAYYEGYQYANINVADATCHLRYLCTACHRFARHFYIKFGPKGEWVAKIGQFPPWDISPNRSIEKALGANSQLYSKGLVCESQGYGIGAFAYYRRIVEEIIDQLLDDIASLIPDAEKAAYGKALALAKATKVAQDKIDLVKDLLPPILRPDGMNPLAVLHAALSEGLHAGTDEECLALAAEIREVLIFLVEQVSATKAASKSFTASMRKLLGRHGGKSA